MALAHKTLVLQDEDGNIINGASIMVQQEVAGAALVPLFSDRAGENTLTNPYVAADGADAGFYAQGGAYKITATLGGFTRVWRHEPMGLAQESDALSEVGLKFFWDTGTSDADPGNGEMRANHASLDSATFLYISKFNRGGDDFEAALLAIEADSILAIEIAGGSAQVQYTVTSVTDATGYVKVGVTGHSGATSIAPTEAVAVAELRRGDPGTDPGVLLTWDTGTSDADPGSGKFRANNASLASATFLYVSKTSRGGSSIAAFLATLDDASNPVKGTLVLTRPSDEVQAVLQVTSLTDATNYVKVGVQNHSGATSFTNLDPVSFQFSRSGDDFAGKHTIWVPAVAMTPRSTNGAAAGSVELTTNKEMFRTLDFDTSTQEFAQFAIHMPKGWNEGTVTFQAVWSHPSTATNFGVVWALEAVALSDDDAGDASFGTAQTSTDTGGTTNDIYISPESSAITIGGTPAENDYVIFQVKRVPADGSDTLAVDARLHGIKLFYTTNTATDA